MMNFPPDDPRPDVGCVVKAIVVLAVLAVLALVLIAHYTHRGGSE